MSKINIPIPKQAFELIRDRIGDILIDELNNQAILNDDTYIDASVFVERSNPIDKDEVPAINISVARGMYDNKHAISSDGNYTYNIDGYSSAKSSDGKEGDSLASIRLQRLLGVCRAIFENPVYNTLGFQKPFISRVSCGDINFAEATNQDSCHMVMGRLTLNVRVPETVSTIIPILLAGYETKVRIGTTEQGYYYKG